jgi:hypothetical protein
MIYTHPLCDFLRAAKVAGRLDGWKPLGENRWVLNIPGERCRDDWTDEQVVEWLAR